MEAAIRPARVMAAIVALQGSKTKLHIFQSGLILTLLTVAVVIRQILVPVNESKGFIIASVEFASYNFRLPTVFCCLIMTNRKRKNIEDFLFSILVLDKKLDSMGFPIDYSHIYKHVRRLFGFTFFKIIVQQIAFFIQGFSWNTTDYFDYIIHNVPLIIFHVLIMEWIIYLMILHVHFKKLNTILKTLFYEECWMVEDFKRKKTNRKHEIIRSCGSLYDTLCTQTREINNGFAWQILCLIPTVFILIIFNSFQTCRMIKKLIGFDCVWIVFDILYFAVFLELVAPCVAVREECEKFADTLHKINDNGVGEAINFLILQSYHQKVEFSACGVFPLDGTLIYTVLGAVTTYLVILLQFDL